MQRMGYRDGLSKMLMPMIVSICVFVRTCILRSPRNICMRMFLIIHGLKCSLSRFLYVCQNLVLVSQSYATHACMLAASFWSARVRTWDTYPATASLCYSYLKGKAVKTDDFKVIHQHTMIFTMHVFGGTRTRARARTHILACPGWAILDCFCFEKQCKSNKLCCCTCQNSSMLTVFYVCTQSKSVSRTI